MKIVSTDSAPAPAGHYSQAVIHGGLVFVAGQLPKDAETGEIGSGSIVEQTRLVLVNLSRILEAAGSDLEHVLKVTVYVPDISMWGSVNAIYAEFFGDHKPARVVVPTRDLHHGCLIEIDAIAALPESG